MSRPALKLQVQALAARRGYSAAELARRAGIPAQTVRKIFKDPERMPQTVTLYKLARALECRSIADLFEE